MCKEGHKSAVLVTLANAPRGHSHTARSDETWEVDPAQLRQLAEELSLLVAEADALGYVWEQRAERDG